MKLNAEHTVAAWKGRQRGPCSGESAAGFAELSE